MAHTPVDDALQTNRGSPESQRAAFRLQRTAVEHAYLGPVQQALRLQPFHHSEPQNCFDADLAGEQGQGRGDAGERSSPSGAAPRPCWRATKTAKRDDKQILQNYKQLQFCDTFALYFHLRHATERADETYIHVPMSREADASIEVKKIDDGTYSLDPFPLQGQRDPGLPRTLYAAHSRGPGAERSRRGAAGVAPEQPELSSGPGVNAQSPQATWC